MMHLATHTIHKLGYYETVSIHWVFILVINRACIVLTAMWVSTRSITTWEWKSHGRRSMNTVSTRMNPTDMPWFENLVSWRCAVRRLVRVRRRFCVRRRQFPWSWGALL